jgi:hypothetical protein
LISELGGIRCSIGGVKGIRGGGDDEEESRRRPLVVSFFAFRWPAFLPRTCSPDPWLLTSPHPDVLQLPCRAAHRRARQLQTEAGRRPYKCSLPDPSSSLTLHLRRPLLKDSHDQPIRRGREVDLEAVAGAGIGAGVLQGARIVEEGMAGRTWTSIGSETSEIGGTRRGEEEEERFRVARWMIAPTSAARGRWTMATARGLEEKTR